MFETYYELMRRQGISRRSFVKFCSLTAASMGLGEAGAQQMQQAMQTKPRLPVIWLHGLECTCCSESFIRSSHPLAKDAVLSMISLDVRRAQARFYPAVHPLASYAEDARRFAPFWAGAGNGEWLALRTRFLALLDEQARLERMARIIGKDALPVRQQLTLLAAGLVDEAFLRQNAFAPKDRVCSPARQAAMMRLVGRFVDRAEAAVGAGVHPERIAALPCLRPLQRMGEEIGDDELPRLAALEARLDREFAALAPASSATAAAAATKVPDAPDR